MLSNKSFSRELIFPVPLQSLRFEIHNEYQQTSWSLIFCSTFHCYCSYSMVAVSDKRRRCRQGKQWEEAIKERKIIASCEGSTRYSAQYYSNLGLMITAINNVFANQQKRTYWEFIDAKTLKPLECGVSTFVPFNEDVILFNLTTY
ncbi:gastric intrinsic factor isoform X2 [Biomphalaria glabrata]|nr:gastric intrinsic factor isoform X2 [Biomphalaria glabrata]